MNHKTGRKKKRQRRAGLGSGQRFRPYSQIDLEEAGIENFEFGDGSELDWDDPDVGYRRNMLNDRS